MKVPALCNATGAAISRMHGLLTFGCPTFLCHDFKAAAPIFRAVYHPKQGTHCRCWYTNNTETAEGCDDFWTNPEAIQLYKDSVRTILTRKNTINGLTYGQDPTIFAWNLINEGRCESDNCTSADIQVPKHDMPKEQLLLCPALLAQHMLVPPGQLEVSTAFERCHCLQR